MSLYKRTGSEIWWAGISIPGHGRVRQSTGEHDRTAAQRVHDELAAQLWKIEPALKGKTWARAVDKWVEAEERSDSEILSLAKFGRVYPDRLLTAVTPESIDKALSFCKTAGTYTRYRTMIAAILNLSGVKLRLVSRRDKKKKTRDWITPEQWTKLYAELPPHMKPMAKFAVETGLRQANVLGLTWSRVDLARKIVWVEAEEMKGGEAIAIPLSTGALDVLRNQEGQHHEYVFTYRGRPVSEIKTAFQAACLRAGLGAYSGGGSDLRRTGSGDREGRRVEHRIHNGDRQSPSRVSGRPPAPANKLPRTYTGFTWHGLRHTWATWHIQNGTPVEVLQKLGGWSDLRMVMTYAHHSPGYLAQFANNARKKK